MRVALVKYNAGNIQSVTAALNRIGIEPVLTDDADELLKADKVIFPGVGEASTALRYLKEKNLDKLIPALKQPVLGICLGLQLMCSSTEEGNTTCLDIFPVHVKRFPPEDKVPHMGWNSIEHLKTPLFQGLPEESYVYFVHSYYAELSSYTIATTKYILPFSAALHKDNFYAVQFHPEKSGKEGEVIIKNFIAL
jgi:imidazole glycerol-phosphate synthase subunit HisH